MITSINKQRNEEYITKMKNLKAIFQILQLPNNYKLDYGEFDSTGIYRKTIFGDELIGHFFFHEDEIPQIHIVFNKLKEFKRIEKRIEKNKVRFKISILDSQFHGKVTE